jgi:glucose-6-phosphate 1-dehydrogenase
MHLQTVEMKLSYQEAFAVRSPDALETLLRDVMKNDAALFMRADQIEAARHLGSGGYSGGCLRKDTVGHCLLN